MKKWNIEAQLATKKRALDQANKLAEARRKLAEMEAEVENLQKTYQEMPEGSCRGISGVPTAGWRSAPTYSQ